MPSPQATPLNPYFIISSPLRPPKRLKYRPFLGIKFPPLPQSSQKLPSTRAHAPFPPIFAQKRPNHPRQISPGFIPPSRRPSPTAFHAIPSPCCKPGTRNPKPHQPPVPCLLSTVYSPLLSSLIHTVLEIVLWQAPRLAMVRRGAAAVPDGTEPTFRTTSNRGGTGR